MVGKADKNIHVILLNVFSPSGFGYAALIRLLKDDRGALSR